MFKIPKILSSFCAGLALLSAAPGAAQSRDTMETPWGDTIEVIEFEQKEAADIFLDIERNIPEDSQIPEYIQKDIIRQMFEDEIKKRLIDKFAIHPVRAQAMATATYKIYDINPMIFSKKPSFNYKTLQPGNGAAAVTPFNLAALGFTTPLETRFCIVGKSDPNFTSRQWLSELFNTPPQQTITLSPAQEKLGGVFSHFANTHEKSHCVVGFDETRADYIATLELLALAKDNDSLESQKQFLYMWASFRAYGFITKTQSPEYALTTNAVFKALRDFEENPNKFSSRKKIYSEAMKANLSNAPLTIENQERVKNTLLNMFPAS